MKNWMGVGDIFDVAKERKIYFFVPFVIVSVVSAIGAFSVPKRYQAYTTILLQQEQTLNPLLNYEQALMSVNNYQLATFNEIVFSRSAVRNLIDSLGLKPAQDNNAGWDNLIRSTVRKITTDLQGANSFRITFTDSDPVMCQKAATALCNIYIETSLKSDRQLADEAVKFLELKVEEMRKEFTAQQQKYLSNKHQDLADSPLNDEGLQHELVKVRSDLVDNQRELDQRQAALNNLKMFEENIDNPSIISQIAALPNTSGPVTYVDSLKSVSIRYSQLLAKYKPRYPQVETARRELLSLLQKSAEALDGALQQTRSDRAGLISSQERILRDISKSAEGSITGDARASEYIRIKDNFESVKQKLDQAKAAKNLADRGASKFVILDPAVVPSTATKPNRQTIIIGGLTLGIIMGLAVMFLMEYSDPTIRRQEDVAGFKKPVIAYLP